MTTASAPISTGRRAYLKARQRIAELEQRLSKQAVMIDHDAITPSMLQLVLNHLPQTIFWKDRNLVFLGCNERFARDDAALTSPRLSARPTTTCPGSRRPICTAPMIAG
ncbi:MAG: hypothetical protein U0Z44_04405 [Kouleothrix sp.]